MTGRLPGLQWAGFSGVMSVYWNTVEPGQAEPKLPHWRHKNGVLQIGRGIALMLSAAFFLCSLILVLKLKR